MGSLQGQLDGIRIVHTLIHMTTVELEPSSFNPTVVDALENLDAILDGDTPETEIRIVDETTLEDEIAATRQRIEEIVERDPGSRDNKGELLGYLRSLNYTNELVTAQQQHHDVLPPEDRQLLFRAVNAFRYALSIEDRELGLYCMFWTLISLQKWFDSVPRSFIEVEGVYSPTTQGVGVAREAVVGVAYNIRCCAINRVLDIDNSVNLMTVFGGDASHGRFDNWWRKVKGYGAEW